MLNALHICFIVDSYPPAIESPNEVLNDLFTLTEWSETLQRKGNKISAIIRFKTDRRIERNGVLYLFVADDNGPELAFWESSDFFEKPLKELQPDIVHCHNMNKVFQHKFLLEKIDSTLPVVLQNHAETPKYWIRRIFQKSIYKRINLALFNSIGQEKVWVDADIFPSKKLAYVQEGSSHFKYEAIQDAQKKSGLSGNPVFLWVGNLDKNKDPFTILKAFHRIVRDYPEARLYMLYRFENLLQEIEAFLDLFPKLKAAVHILGRKKREELEVIYNTANYFVLGSYSEGSGYSLLEAMACGCVPIVTDISSFRTFTENGKYGKLFKPGDDYGLELSIRMLMEEDWEENSEKVRNHFVQNLSYDALGEKMMGYYRGLV